MKGTYEILDFVGECNLLKIGWDLRSNHSPGQPSSCDAYTQLVTRCMAVLASKMLRVAEHLICRSSDITAVLPDQVAAMVWVFRRLQPSIRPSISWTDP